MERNETITQRKDGRYMGRFIIDYESNGKPVYQYVYGKTYDEAEQKLRIARDIESQYLSGRHITVQKVYTEWLNAIVNRVKESTYANYTMKFEKHILPVLGNMLCTAVNSAKINAFIKDKMESGLSAGYVRDLFAVFKSLLTYAQEEYGFRLSLKNVSLPKAEKKKLHKMDDEQQKKLVCFIKSHIDLTGLGVLLSLFMGLRIGELCGLKWGDIDITHKILRVNRTAQRMIAKKSGSTSITFEAKNDNEVRGVDIYMGSKWKKPAIAAAACLLLVGGVFGGAALLSNSRERNDSPSDSYYASVDESRSEPIKKEKTVITAAFLYAYTDYEKMVNNFNRSQDDYTIELVDYFQYNDDVKGGVYGEGAIRQLKIDIAAGDAPDIIVTNDHSLITMLGNKGTFADLYGFMENDPEVNKETLMPNVLKAFESSDGKLYSLAPTYQIKTMAVKKKFGQKENWSIDDMIAFYDSASSTADHLYDSVERETMLTEILSGMSELVNYDEAECYFDSDEFIKVLEFCDRFIDKMEHPDKISETNAYNEYLMDKSTWTTLDRAPLLIEKLIGKTSFAYSQISGIKYDSFGGEDFTFVGFPTSTGKGGQIKINGEFAILDTCSDKNAAWQFVRQFFTKETQAVLELDAKKEYSKAYPVDYMRVRKDCFEDWLESQKYCVTSSDDGKIIKADHIDKVGITIYAPSNEEIADYRRYILSCDTLYGNIDSDIMSICKEEAAAYFAGDCTAKQAAERIQSRCSILLSENS